MKTRIKDVGVRCVVDGWKASIEIMDNGSEACKALAFHLRLSCGLIESCAEKEEVTSE